MNEPFHYLGNFDFHFGKTDKKNLAQAFLKYVFPEEVIKKARGKKYESIESSELVECTKRLSDIFGGLNPDQCSIIIHKFASRNLDLTVSLYLIAKHRLTNASLRKGYFNVKDELGRLVIKSII